MRVALACCLDDESVAVRRRLGDLCTSASPALNAGGFDFIIIGTAPGRGAAIDAVHHIDVPHLVLLRSRDDYETVGEDIPALALDDIDALRHVMRRETLLHNTQDHRRALAESESRYRDLVSRIPGAVWTSLKSGEILFASEQIEQITGFTPDEFLGGGFKLWASHVHPSDVGALFDKWNEVFSKGEGSFEAEYRFMRKEGRWVWLQQRIALVPDPREPYVAVIAMDVTARRAAEEALRSSELRYRTLVEQATDTIFGLDVEGRFQSLNPAFEELTGWTCAEWIGRAFVEIVEPASLHRASDTFRAALAGERVGYSEYDLRTNRGHSITVEATVQRIAHDDETIGIIAIARDVTARKRAEAEAAKEKRLASLGQLATSVAHEFNNVLMSIMPFAELLQRKLPGDERVTTATAHIIQAVRRGREISTDVLRFARPVKPALESIALAGWLDEFGARVEALLGPMFEVERRVLLNGGGELVITADRALLEQVVLNVIHNSREAMPKGGKITIEAKRSREPGTIEISICDTGSGISPSAIDHVFEPLFTTKRSGSGLGLSIAYQAMKQQDGAINVHSTVGEGSTFTLTFRESEPASASAPAPDEERHRRILIVEDDEAVGEGLSLLLGDEGYEVRLVANGFDSKKAIADFKPDLVLLDMNLPDMSGIDVYDQIRSTSPELPVIFSTGQADARAVEDLLQRKVPSIMKPYDVQELMAVIASLPTPI
jgi:PAS domain S-box-containing protein